MAEKDDYSYKKIEIFRHLTLGSGSYGKVFLAQCDNLPCAAKVLHPTLFPNRTAGEGGGGGGQRILERFYQEINILKRMRHPNIVLYLQVIRDEDTGFPILLMEKIDENLTSFLQRSRLPVPFRTQVDICCDVAQAIAHLHSHSIIHRDLSSGNILIVAGCKAKVTDFGMCRFMERDTRMSSAPGTVVYMPPEAFDPEPKYRDKIDCFSFGPLIIQIITGEYPNPKPLKAVMSDASYPMGYIPLESEADRRRKHIELVRKNHPLLRIALNCLENRPEDRPEASDLCRRFAECKSLNGYRNEGMFECLYASDNGEERTFFSDDLRSVPRHPLPLPLLPPLPPKLHKTLGRVPRSIISGSAAASGNMVFFRPDDSNEILAFSDKERKWLSCFPRCPHWAFTLVDIMGTVTAVGGCKDKNSDTNVLLSLVHVEERWVWERTYPPMPTSRSYVAAAFSGHALVVAGGTIKHTKKLTRNVEILAMEDIPTWYVASELPFPISQSVMAICDRRVYLLGGCDQDNHWVKTTITFSTTVSRLREASHPAGELLPPDLPPVWDTETEMSTLRSASLSIEDHLVIVCGRDGGNRWTKDIRRYDHRSKKWEVVGMVSVGRTRCLVAPLSGLRVLVVGGWIEGVERRIKTDTYEIVTLKL